MYDDDEKLTSMNNNGSSEDSKNLHDDVQICGFDDLIPFVNSLHSIFLVNSDLKNNVKLPRLVIVGSQSHGKTSLLENLVQQSFLPKGEGLATKRPILLKLINTNSSSKEMWCEFGHIQDKKFYNFREVESVIAQLTNKVGFGISDEVIELSIYSPNVVTLTIVDLPGLTQVPKAGHPGDTPAKIRQMVLDYITPKDSIILAVSAANDDFENSASLAIAREVDPNGERTLAVLTKMDVAKKSKGVPKLTDILQGRVISVKLGIIGVINRSDADMKKGKSFTDVLAEEKNFFMQHFPKFGSKHGTEYLAHYLNRLLLKHIEACLPQIETLLKQQLTISRQELSEMGDPVNLSSDGKRSIMIDIITSFANTYKAQIDGRSRNINLSVPCGGAKIEHCFNVIFNNELKKVATLGFISDHEIIFAIRNSHQIQTKLFTLEIIFKELAKIQIEKMRKPVIDCAQLVYAELINMINQCINETAKRFPKVIRQITQIVNEMLYKNHENSIASLEQYMNIQSSSAITTDDDFYKFMEKYVQSLKVFDIGKLPLDILLNNSENFVSGSENNSEEVRVEKDEQINSNGDIVNDDNNDNDNDNVNDDDDSGDDDSDDDIVNVKKTNVKQALSVDGHSKYNVELTNSSQHNKSLSPEQLAVFNVTRKLTEKFLVIVFNQVKDYVPKSLLYTLIYATIDSVHQELTNRLVVDEKIENLIMESERMVAKRESVSRKQQDIEEACKRLEEMQENCLF